MTVKNLGDAERRPDVLDAAMRTFTRFGYRKTSMDDVAKEARISRPGLYFLFTSKSGLFREAAERGVELDLLAAERALTASALTNSALTNSAHAVTARALDDRIVDAFMCWAGRYIGPIQDTTALIDDNPELLGPIARGGPKRFEAILIAALEQAALFRDTSIVARTLISLSIGIKHQAADRDEYRARMTDAVRLLIPVEQQPSG